jgi:lipid II:glycine glycyltransferase (peptidoglycan interpeptide bridge formation enzyme)
MLRHEAISVQRVDKTTLTACAGGFADYNFEQTPEYATAMADRQGDSTLFFAIHSAARLLGLATVRLRTLPLIGQTIAYISGGPITQTLNTADSSQFERVLSALKSNLVEEERHFLLVRPPALPPFEVGNAGRVLRAVGFLRSTKARAYRTIAIDLRSELTTIRSKLGGTWRRNLRRAENAGLSIEIGSGYRMVERFGALYEEMRRAKNLNPRVSPTLLLALPRQSIGLQVLIATKNGRDVGAHVLSCLGKTAVFLFGATNQSGRATTAGYLLHWKSIVLSKELDIDWYDLGGVDPIANPGGNQFKSGTKGLMLPPVEPWEARPKGDFSSALSSMWSLHTLLRSL